jgi:hypothetical protein
MTRLSITEEQAKYAMAHDEFPAEVVTAAEHVAVVCTQGWCPQWQAMERYLEKLAPAGSDERMRLFVLVYDRVPYFDEFRTFKESVWQNVQVPYVRYYSGGLLVGESNYVPKKRFLATLQRDASEAGR